MRAPDAIADYFNMKKRLPLYLLLVLVFLTDEPIHAKNNFYVRWVDDGDTIVLADGRRVRYIGINAPEIAHRDQKAEPYGNTAKKFNRT
jgi:endonuclease YncB( thermonuclease family)